MSQLPREEIGKVVKAIGLFQEALGRALLMEALGVPTKEVKSMTYGVDDTISDLEEGLFALRKKMKEYVEDES